MLLLEWHKSTETHKNWVTLFIFLHDDHVHVCSHLVHYYTFFSNFTLLVGVVAANLTIHISNHHTSIKYIHL